MDDGLLYIRGSDLIINFKFKATKLT